MQWNASLKHFFICSFSSWSFVPLPFLPQFRPNTGFAGSSLRNFLIRLFQNGFPLSASRGANQHRHFYQFVFPRKRHNDHPQTNIMSRRIRDRGASGFITILNGGEGAYFSLVSALCPPFKMSIGE